MKIIVTGGCGFIGSNYIQNKIRDPNCQILNLDNLSYAGTGGNLASLANERYKFVKCDILDFDLVSECIKDFLPNIIINFAAETHVDRSIDSPNKFVNTNVSGTVNLLHCSQNYFESNISKKDFRFFHISTDEVFGSLNEFDLDLFKENTPYSPNSPYSASKASSDHFVRAWNHTYGLPTLISNCSNNYGPFQFPEKLIPLITINCIQEKELPIYGDGTNIRDWIFVEDHCRAIDAIINRGKAGHTYNVGGNNELTNLSLVKTICSIFDDIRPRMNGKPYSDLIKFVKDRPGHDVRYAVCIDKITQNTNWKPEMNFETGLKKTILWYIQNEKWWRNIQTNIYNQERLGLISK